MKKKAYEEKQFNWELERLDILQTKEKELKLMQETYKKQMLDASSLLRLELTNEIIKTKTSLLKDKDQIKLQLIILLGMIRIGCIIALRLNRKKYSAAKIDSFRGMEFILG